ncbi:MAG: TraB/GumN family protein [Chitinophagales bacterium]|nr:TraB/GumN family protein [Chitinophagales bacterium]
MTYLYNRFISISFFTTLLLTTYWVLFPLSSAAQSYKSLLWQIEGKGMKTPSYLYGTMHSKDLRVHDLSDSVYVAIERCPAMALEIVTQAQDQATLMAKMFMRDTTLQQLYSPEDYAKVNAAIQKKMGLMALMFKTDKMKPIFLVTMLGELAIPDSTAPQQAAVPLDSFLQQWGEENKKRLIGIESVNEQMSALDRISLRDQAAMLFEYLSDEEHSDSLETTMMRYYLHQDLDSLWIFYERQKGLGYTEFDRSLIQQRNDAMAQRIDSLLQHQATFVAVGALHLPSPKGLIAQLRGRGYIIKPVYNRKQVWYGVNSAALGLTLKFPAQPSADLLDMPEYPLPTTGKTDTAALAIMYSSEDTMQGLYYSAVCIPVADTTMSDDDFYIALSERLLLKDNAVMVSQDTITENGLKILEGELDLGYDMEGMSMRFRLLRHRNRVYMLSVVGLLEDIYAPQTDIFFRSFKATP